MAKDYGAITSLDTLEKLVNKMLDEKKYVGFDLETGYLGPDAKKRSVDHFHKDQFVVGFSFTNSQEWARYVPLRHDCGGNIEDEKAAWDIMRPLLENSDIVAHNIKFEILGVAKAAGIELGKNGTITDTALGLYVLNKYAYENYRSVIGLKDSVEIALDHKMMHIHDLWPDLPANKNDYIRFNTLPLTPEVVAYACEDALWVLPLRETICVPAEQERPFIYNLEHNIVRILADMEHKGVYIDWQAIAEAYAEAQQFVPRMEQYVKEELGKLAERDVSDLNLNSPVQVKKLLFQDIGLSTTRLTKKGAEDESLEDWQKMSTDAKALTGLAKDHEAIEAFLEYKEVQNLTRRLKKWVTEYNLYDDNRVHANYNQVQVPTGRFSAGDPAIQQLPKKWGWEIPNYSWKGNFRDFIIAPEGSYFLTFDYSQAELRMLAGASQEPALLEAFSSGTDIHSATAAQMLGLPLSEIDDELRKIGKTLNFSLLYGQGIKALGETLGVTIERAKELHGNYFSSFSRVASWVNRMKRTGFDQKYAETVFDRKIPVWELQSANNGIVAKGERVLINGPIQGAAADYMKVAMVRVYRALKAKGWWGDKVTVVMNQHDSLTFEVTNDIDPNELKPLLQECVVLDSRSVERLKDYPIMQADWELGKRWGSSDKWDDNSIAVFEDGRWQIKSPTPSKLILSVDQNPSQDAFITFMATLKEHPGNTTVEIRLTDGTVTVPMTVDLDYSTQNKLAKLLGSAKIEREFEQAGS